MSKKGFIYLLESEKDGRFYYGSTNNIGKRCVRHNAGKVISTKKSIPWTLRAVVSVEKIELARSIEQKIKRRKEKIIPSKFLLLVGKYLNDDNC